MTRKIGWFLAWNVKNLVTSLTGISSQYLTKKFPVKISKPTAAKLKIIKFHVIAHSRISGKSRFSANLIAIQRLKKSNRLVPQTIWKFTRWISYQIGLKSRIFTSCMVGHDFRRNWTIFVGFSGNFHPKMTGKLKKCDSFFQNPCHFDPHGRSGFSDFSSKFDDFTISRSTHLSSPTIAINIIITWWRNVM